MTEPPAKAAIRFWRSVPHRPGPHACWVWRSKVDRYGYGLYREQRGDRRRSWRAHRVAYELMIGPIPDGLVLDHLCRVRNCVNPSHLEPVTNTENVRRGRGYGWGGRRNDWLAEAIRLYPSLSTTALGQRFGVHRQSVINALRTAGVEIQPRGRVRRPAA